MVPDESAKKGLIPLPFLDRQGIKAGLFLPDISLY